MNRLLDWLCTHLGLCIRFDGDLMTPDCPDDAGDPHYRRPQETQYMDEMVTLLPPLSQRHVKVRIVTPQEHAARLKERRR